MEAALLLAMMISYCSEHTQFLLGDRDGLQEVRLESDGPLENVRRVSKLVRVSLHVFAYLICVCSPFSVAV